MMIYKITKKCNEENVRTGHINSYLTDKKKCYRETGRPIGRKTDRQADRPGLVPTPNGGSAGNKEFEGLGGFKSV